VKQELKPEDIAIVLRPIGYEDAWDGEVGVSVIIPDDTPVPFEVSMHILNMATMMTAFLEVARENPDVYAEVEDHRNYTLSLYSEEGLDVVQDGNVHTLNKWTKTEGSA